MAVICTGFVVPSRSVAEAEGLATMRLVEYPPPNIGVQGTQEVYQHAQAILDQVVEALTAPVRDEKEAATKSPEADPRQIIFKGALEEVNDFFGEKRWNDGLPIAPPTLEAVEEMLKYTGRRPEEVLGVLPPALCQATVWNVAVNGVMAGCLPQYMPVLIAVAEAIAEPAFRLTRAGSTVGGVPMIIINGPIIKQLGFNCGQGLLRSDRQANTTVARFLRLCMGNIAGYSTGLADMATFGRNYFPVLAEAEDESPWIPLSTELGFDRGKNVVTVYICISMGVHFKSMGTGSDLLKVLAIESARELAGAVNYLALHGSEVSPLVCLSPLIASRIAGDGFSRNDIRQFLFRNARIPACQFDEQIGRDRPNYTACDAVKLGKLPPLFCETEDPNRMVPVVHRADQYQVVVSGDKFRNRCFIAAQTGSPVSREIRLPQNYRQLLEEADRS